MEERRPLTLKQAAAYIVLTALIVAAVWLGLKVLTLNEEVQRVQSLTPTPVPGYGNVMLVTPNASAPTAEPIIRTGSAGDSVLEMQTRLAELGYYKGDLDGQFGPATRTAVTLFQEQHGLDADGMFGPNTSAVLYSDQAHQVVATPTPSPAPTASAIPWVTADGMPLLVNSDHHLPDGYLTLELVNMRSYCDSDVVIIKGSEIEGEKLAVDALMTMLRAAHEDGLTVWQVSAGYRSVAYQQQLFDDKVYAYRQEGYSGSQARALTRQTVADPGASEHHTGLAFDITVPGEQFSNTQQHIWLAQHCWEYGFIIRYPLDKVDITGISYEPWHIRYVGTAHSLIMRDENLCLEEYIDKYAN